MRTFKIFLLIIVGWCFSHAGIDSLVVTIHSDTVLVRHVDGGDYCNTKYLFDVSVASDTITIVERDTSVGHFVCRCNYYDLSMTLSGLKSGNYYLQVFRQELKKYNYKTDTTFFMCSTNFHYVGSDFPRYSYRGFYSNCSGKTFSNDMVIYFNSFETTHDTVGWKGFLKFHSEAPLEGGKQSVYISGGCIWPHAWFELPPVEKDGYYLLRCWGKDLEIGGSVSIEAEGNIYKKVYIAVNNKEWTLCQSAETLDRPAGKKIILSMGAGGFAPSSMLIDRIEIVKVDQVTSVEELGDNLLPQTFGLYQNYPNPFNPTTVISYRLPVNNYVTLKVYDLLGRDVATLVNEVKKAGYYSVTFNALKLSSGVYYARLQSGDKMQLMKMSLVK